MVYLTNSFLMSFYSRYSRCFTLKTFRKKWLLTKIWFRPMLIKKNIGLFLFCISWYMLSKTFSLIVLFVKKRLYLTYQKSPISFSLTFWNMLFIWYVRCHCSPLTRGTRLLSVRRSKYCLEFSIAWGRLKISVSVPFVFNFRSLSNKFTTIFWRLIFQILLPRLG